jgi:2-polyprenyl-3-methyl-5-hydroxy-6-metoxy-1,4-benzoquinol methylase
MAMIEHLPDSPKPLLENLRRLVHPEGKVLVEVPNLLYWPNRLKILRGRTVHQPLNLVYDSETPYIGHHREYTEDELRDVLSWSGFKVDDVMAFNYSLSLDGDISTRLYVLLVYLWPTVLRSCREVLLACAEPA